MSQSWLMPVLAGDKGSTAVLSKINDSLEALRTLHSGGSTPALTVAYMLWLDSGTPMVKQRNAGNTTDQEVWAPNVQNHRDEPQIYIGALTGSLNFPLYAPGQAWTAIELVVLSDTTTSSSDGSNNWGFQVRNATAAVDLFGTAPDTNGDELTAQTPWIQAFDQNTGITADDYLELQVTQTGTPTALSSAKITVGIRGKLVGA